MQASSGNRSRSKRSMVGTSVDVAIPSTFPRLGHSFHRSPATMRVAILCLLPVEACFLCASATKLPSCTFRAIDSLVLAERMHSS